MGERVAGGRSNVQAPAGRPARCGAAPGGLLGPFREAAAALGVEQPSRRFGSCSVSRQPRVRATVAAARLVPGVAQPGRRRTPRTPPAGRWRRVRGAATPRRARRVRSAARRTTAGRTRSAWSGSAGAVCRRTQTQTWASSPRGFQVVFTSAVLGERVVAEREPLAVGGHPGQRGRAHARTSRGRPDVRRHTGTPARISRAASTCNATRASSPPICATNSSPVSRPERLRHLVEEDQPASRSGCLEPVAAADRADESPGDVDRSAARRTGPPRSPRRGAPAGRAPRVGGSGTATVRRRARPRRVRCPSHSCPSHRECGGCGRVQSAERPPHGRGGST